MHKIAAILPPEDTAGADQCYCAEENAYGFSVASMYNAKLHEMNVIFLSFVGKECDFDFICYYGFSCGQFLILRIIMINCI
jgi:hypothetical protein